MRRKNNAREQSNGLKFAVVRIADYAVGNASSNKQNNGGNSDG
jgi:hypothetical protein